MVDRSAGVGFAVLVETPGASVRAQPARAITTRTIANCDERTAASRSGRIREAGTLSRARSFSLVRTFGYSVFILLVHLGVAELARIRWNSHLIQQLSI